MNKLLIPILASVLVLGTLGLSEVYGPTEELFGNYHIISQGTALCEIDERICWIAKTHTRNNLNVDTIGKGIVSGTADGVIYIHGTADDNLKSKTGKHEPPKPLSLVYHTIRWDFVSSSNELTMNGVATAPNGEKFKLSVLAVQTDSVKQLAIPDWFFKYTLVSHDRTITGFTIGTGTDILELVDKSAEK
ncbi:hypothetical protein [Nitrosopumilus sp. S6]